MQAMGLTLWRKWWARLQSKLGWGADSHPVWGPEPPTILGVCCHCGAVVLKGWERQTPEGLLCRRCAGEG